MSSHKRAFFIWMAGMFLFLSGCQEITPETYHINTAAPAPTVRYITTLAADLPTPTPTPTEAVASPAEVVLPGVPPTSVMVPVTSTPAPDEEALSQAPTPAPDPLRFVFPTASRPPVSAWRPALYPIPWSIYPYDHFYFARPIAADEVNSPVWDYRYGGTFFADIIHTGIDLPTPNGTPVLAAGAGKVVWAGFGLYRGWEDKSDPYGLAVAVFHDFGYQNQALYTVYGHLQEVDVIPGQRVETGQVLGQSGETGKVTGPHLHFEVRVGNNDYFSSRNPELWLVPPQGWGVLAGRVMNSGGVLRPGQKVIVRSHATGQNWIVHSYGETSVNRDAYYQENLVLSDLPAGRYDIRIPYVGFEYKTEIEIYPGLVNYFSFLGHDGFEIGLPPMPGSEFTPESPSQDT